MKHSLVIHVSRRPPPDGIVSCRQLHPRERIMRFLFGPKRRLTILIPDKSVEEVFINTTDTSTANGGCQDETV